MNQPFEELTGNPIWAEFRRQADSDPDRINLTDLWRASGRQRGWSPRQYARMYHSKIKRLDCQGAKPDDPAYADEATAYHYIQLLDPEIMDVCGKVFFAAIRENPAGMLLSACSHSDGAGSVAGLFISAANTVDGDCIEGNRRILRAAVEMTRDLDIFSQETAIAQAQRALSGVREIRTERMVDDEMEFDE